VSCSRSPSPSSAFKPYLIYGIMAECTSNIFDVFSIQEHTAFLMIYWDMIPSQAYFTLIFPKDEVAR